MPRCAGIVWWLTVSYLLLGIQSHASCGPRTPQKCSRHNLASELERTADQFIDAVKSGESKTFLALVSRQGVVFGVDVPPLSFEMIRTQISRKQGVYCGLFDTSCLRQGDARERANLGVPASKEPIYSIREQLRQANSLNVRAGVSRAGASWLGLVTVELRKDLFQSPLEFEFVYEEGRWRLSGLPGY